MNVAYDIAAHLEQHRKAVGMSRQSLGKRTGISSRTIKRILDGETSCDFSKLVRITEALGGRISLRLGKPSGVRKRQARRKAAELTSLMQGSAALEAQAVDEKVVRRTQRKIADSLLRGPKLKLWG